MDRKTKSWLEYFTSKKGIVLVLLFTLFILFKTSIWSYYNKTIIDGILSKIKSHWIVDILLLLLLAYSLILTITYFKKKKRLTATFFCISLFAFILFLYCRSLTNKYNYETFEWIPTLKYVDYFFFLFGCVLLITIGGWSTKNKEPFYKSSPFLVDKPILHAADDKFGRKDFAKKIAEKIQSKLKIEGAGSLAIGINGPWGSGKTSFTNMIKDNIDNKNRIIIDFNPWRSSTSSKIIEDFFELLVSEIKPHDPTLSSEIYNYAKSLTEIDENLITKTTKAVSDILFDPISKNVAYDSINYSIKKIKKQILIFVDDLDRLDKREIIEILRIVRNTANFNNVVYIVSYDRKYIQVAIKDFNEYNYKSFLEKIFQFEFTLPLYESGVLRTEIKKILKEQLGNEFQSQIDRVIDSKEYSGINFTNEIVKTYRDVIRLSNSLLFEIESIKNEVYFYDFYLLQLLKLKYSKVYEALVENRHLFFKLKKENGTNILKEQNEAWEGADTLIVSELFDNRPSNQNQNKENQTISSFETYLNTNKDILDLTDHDKILIKFLVDTLLQLKETKTERQDTDLYKSFAYPNNFHKYFAFRLYEGDISAMEFESSRRMSFEKYKAKVHEWISLGKYSILIDRLDKVSDFTTVLEFENHIKILVEIGHIQAKENNPHWIDYSLIIRNLQYPIERKELRVYSKQEDYISFIMKLFNDAPNPPIYESHLIARLIGGLISHHIKFVLTTSQLSEINFKYFKTYCENHSEITYDFRQLHYNAIRSTDEFHYSTEIIPEAEELFVSYFKKHLKGCELSGFIQQTSPGYEYFLINKEWLFKIFKDWHGFESYLELSDSIKTDWDCYNEFKIFYEETKKHNYSPVEFKFKSLNPTKFS